MPGLEQPDGGLIQIKANTTHFGQASCVYRLPAANPGIDVGRGPGVGAKASMSSSQPSFGSGPTTRQTERARQLDAIFWAVFFIWVGIAMLAGLPWGWFLLVTAMLILAVQIGRWRTGVEVETFWTACGVVLLAGAVWRLLDLPLPLAPLLLILLGVVSLGKTISRARS